MVPRGNVAAADGEGGSMAAIAGAELVFDVDPFFEAAASAVSSANATAALPESALWRAATWAWMLACRHTEVASAVPCPRTRAISTNRVNRDLTRA
jgi:hypothetical protein